MKITLTYFKDSGKYYSQGELEVQDSWRDKPWEIYDAIRRRVEARALPGLTEGSVFNTLVEWEDGVPGLIVRPGFGKEEP